MPGLSATSQSLKSRSLADLSESPSGSLPPDSEIHSLVLVREVGKERTQALGPKQTTSLMVKKKWVVIPLLIPYRTPASSGVFM